MPHPTLFFLHHLGGSARSWQPVVDRLAAFRCIPLDLPGFGDQAGHPARTVDAMADHVAAAIRAEAPDRYALIGHSMGAKVAAILARRAEDGAPDLAGLTRLVLLAGSPPGPEPIADEQRATMLGWFAREPDHSRAEAHDYVGQNVAQPFDADAHARAASDVLRTDPTAWRAWLEAGSREDRADQVGRLHTPALLLASADDGPLGPEAQRLTAAKHFAHARLVVLPDAAHLLPIERPDDVARLIEEHVTSSVDPAYRALLDTDRVSARTRDILLARAAPDASNPNPSALNAAQLRTLRTLVDRIVPQPADTRIDLAAAINATLASGAGDGWRFAALPPDRDAYRLALDMLARAGLNDRDAESQDALLHTLADGAFAHPGPLTADQTKLWFEDVRAEATRAYVAHPATLARIGASSVANGGDTEPKSGFVQVGLDEREPWEPVARGAPSEA